MVGRTMRPAVRRRRASTERWRVGKVWLPPVGRMVRRTRRPRRVRPGVVAAMGRPGVVAVVRRPGVIAMVGMITMMSVVSMMGMVSMVRTMASLAMLRGPPMRPSSVAATAGEVMLGFGELRVESTGSIADCLIDALRHALQAVTLADTLLGGPAKCLGEILLLVANHLFQLDHLEAENLKVVKFGVQLAGHLIPGVFVVVEAAKVMNPDHSGAAFDVRDPDRSNLGEANGKADILYRVPVHGVDVETHELLLGEVIPFHAGEVPAGNNDGSLLSTERASTALR